MKPLKIKVLWNNDTTQLLESLDIDTNYDDCDEKLVTIYHVDSLEYAFRCYGIKSVYNIPYNGPAISDKDQVNIYQNNILKKTISRYEYENICYKAMILETKILTFLDTDAVQIRWTKESMNEVYKIIKELGCEGPTPKENQ